MKMEPYKIEGRKASGFKLKKMKGKVKSPKRRKRSPKPMNRFDSRNPFLQDPFLEGRTQQLPQIKSPERVTPKRSESNIKTARKPLRTYSSIQRFTARKSR